MQAMVIRCQDCGIIVMSKGVLCMACWQRAEQRDQRRFELEELMGSPASIVWA